MSFVRALSLPLCLCLALVIFMASCSSATVEIPGDAVGEDDADAPVETPAPTTVAPTVPPTTVAPTIPPTSPPTTAAPTTIAPPSTTAPAGAFEIKDEHIDYCALATQAEENEAAMGEDGFLDPERLEAFVAENLVLLEKARNTVPDEIADDFLVFIDGQYEIERVLSAAGFDFVSVLDDPAFSDPEFEAASNAVEAFGESACGFTDDDEPVEAAGITDADIAAMEAILEDETQRAAFIVSLAEAMGITEEEGACFVDELGAEKLAAMAAMDDAGATDNQVVADIFGAFEVCGIQT